MSICRPEYDRLLPPLRLGASGSPVTRAVEAGRGETFESTHLRLLALKEAVRARLLADSELYREIECGLQVFALAGAR